MQKKMKVKNIPKSMLLSIPAFIVWIMAYVSVKKENAIAWNKMVASAIKFETTCDDDDLDDFCVESDCD
jgi:hypothetical protein